jgi:hypothetical protein
MSHSTEGVPSLDDLVAWNTFLAFWMKYFSHLIIRRPNADICPDCYIAANIIKFGSRGENGDDDDKYNKDDKDDDYGAFPGREMFRQSEREKQIIKAGEHVKLAKRMCELFNSYIDTARDHALAKIDHDFRTYMGIGNYCQKIEMPYFRAEQPADIYYMSAMAVKCFGLVDPTGTCSANSDNVKEYRHLLKAYVYDESVAGCGGNNVASLFIKEDLHDGGLMDRSIGPGGHLIAAFDNCPGQNKNNHVLKTLCAWLVKKEYFLKVTVVFLMKGRTKNPVEHLFNSLKREYRAQNIQTMDALLPILNKSDNVIAMVVVPRDFHDWNGMLKKLYSDFPAVLKYHLFESDDIEEISLQVGPDYPAKIANLRFPKEESVNDRADRLETLFPTQITPPGLKEIKEVELWTKFRGLLKPENQDLTCPYPGDNVMDRIRKQKNEKSVLKKKRKDAIMRGEGAALMN